MKWLPLINIVLLTSCSSVQKSVNQFQQEVKKTAFFKNDSICKLTFDTTSIKRTLVITTSKVDSSFDKVTEEEITEVIDSSVIQRKIRRTVKEKGLKKAEQNTTSSLIDSSHKQYNDESKIIRINIYDSTDNINKRVKKIRKETLFPWWLLILLIIAAAIYCYWKRNWIRKLFFTN